MTQEAPAPTELESVRHTIDPLALEHLEKASHKESTQAIEAAAHATAMRDEADYGVFLEESPIPGKEYILLEN